MKNHKKILIGMIILVVCIIGIVIALLILHNQTVIQQENPETVAFEDIEKLENKTLFFQIEEMVETYMNALSENNQDRIRALSPSKTISFDTNKHYTTFLSQEMYVIDKITNITVYVHEIAREKTANEDDYYLIVNLDYTNDTYEVIHSSYEEFANAKNNKIQETYKKDIIVNKNEQNTIIQGMLTDFQILKKYFEDYKFKAIYRTEEAFLLLNEQYKKEKFDNNIENYQTYIKNTINVLQDANIINHHIEKQGQYGTYTFIDNNNYYYQIEETGIYQYTIVLDNYTLESDELKQQYNRLSNEEKAISNMDKVMKLINVKDYQKIYQYLNEDFRNTKFSSLESFITYMKATFFEDNVVGNIGVKSEGDVYLLRVPYKESLSSSAEKKEKTFIMKLKEGMNFEISFEV